MKRLLLASVFSLFLVGCNTLPGAVSPESTTTVETKYIIRIPPKELLTPPPKVPNIDPDKATQGDVARWLILKEERAQQLEDMLIGIAQFFKTEENKANGIVEKTDGDKPAPVSPTKSADSAIKRLLNITKK